MKKRNKQLEKAKYFTEKSTMQKWIKKIKEKNKGEFVHPLCSGCGEKLNLMDSYAYQYGFCSVSCGYRTYGLNERDFH